MPYEIIGWKNNEPPALNASNLNHMDEGIKRANDAADSMIPEAPNDDIAYSRQNEDWIPNAIQEPAPSNDKKYGMKNGEWTEILEGGSSGFDYSEAINKPQINGVELDGNVSGSDLDIVRIIESPSVSGWVLDDTVAGFSYKGEIEIEGLTDRYAAQVNFAIEDSYTGNYWDKCETAEDAVFIWAREMPEELTLDSIYLTKGEDL